MKPINTTEKLAHLMETLQVAIWANEGGQVRKCLELCQLVHKELAHIIYCELHKDLIHQSREEK